jgi:hypothetical protein
MKNRSPAVAWLALFFLLTGSMVPSPLGCMAFAILASVLSITALLIGKQGAIFSGIVLLLALLLIANCYPQALQELRIYEEYARAH